MSAYVLVDMDVTDPAAYEEYKKAASISVADHGGRYLVRGPQPEALEGDWPLHRVVILEFPGTEQARAWYNSPDYEAAKALRLGAANARFLLLDGQPS